MQLYSHVPYMRLVFYVFTIIFHAILLVRAALEARYLVAAVLAIPVTAISLALLKFVRKTVVAIRQDGTRIIIETLFYRESFEISEIVIRGKEIIVRNRKKFTFNQDRAEMLIDKLGKER